jgi:repressor LexA
VRELTEKQKAILAFMRQYFEQNDQLPPVDKLREHFNWKSSNAAAEHLQTLARKGVIEHNANGKYRFTRTVSTTSP